MEVKVCEAARRSYNVVTTKAALTRRVKRHVERSGIIPWKLSGEHGAEICQISLVALDMHIDNPAAWGDRWYPPTDMAHVREYAESLRSILRISPSLDSASGFVWSLVEPFHALLSGFILILFGKLVAL